MTDTNTATSSPQQPAEVCSAAEAVKRAKEEFEKAQAYYESVRQQAVEGLKAVRACLRRRRDRRHARCGPSPSLHEPDDCGPVGHPARTAVAPLNFDPPMRMVDADLLHRKRELHLRIARSRRRLDGRFRASRDGIGQLLSWRSYVARYPVWAMAAALGAGLAASAGLKPATPSRRLGVSLVRHALGKVQQQLWAELRRVWSEALSDKVDHG